MQRLRIFRRFFVLAAAAVLVFLAGAASAILGICGPFTDVSDAGFCPFVLEIFTLGITTGTTPTTYDPGSSVSRLQMAAFLSRTVDRVLQRGSRRAALRQFWTTQSAQIPVTTLAGSPSFVEYDGADLWVGLSSPGAVSRVRASDGKVLETWTGVADHPRGVLVAMGKVFVVTSGDAAGPTGKLYRIDPSLPAGAATTVASNLAQFAYGIAFDGARIWLTNWPDGTVSIVTPGATVPWTVTTTASVYQNPIGILYDGANIWITDSSSVPGVNGTLLKLNGSGGVLQTVTVGQTPWVPVFDGSNIWVPNSGDSSVTVVRASSGVVLATLTGNGLDDPLQAAFDGQRVLLTNNFNTVSLWKAADLTALGTFPMPVSSFPLGACSDGVNFWIALTNVSRLARF